MSIAKKESEVAQLCPTLCNPMDCSPPGSLVHGIFQARVLEWVAISCSRGFFPTQGLNLGLLHCRQILYHLRHQESPIYFIYSIDSVYMSIPTYQFIQCPPFSPCFYIFSNFGETDNIYDLVSKANTLHYFSSLSCFKHT